MFAKSIILAALAAFAIAGPVARHNDEPKSQCNTGSAQCCNSIYDAKHETESTTSHSLLGAIIGADDLIGLHCSPILGGGTCDAHPVCCTDNNFNGLVAIGCVPINISL